LRFIEKENDEMR